MLPEDYRIYAIWESIRSRKRDAGKLQVLINKEVTKRQLRIYEANLTLLNDMAKSVAKRANDYSACDDSEYIFGHGEWQLNSILIPAFWDIVGKRRGSVLVQCPTGRKRAKDPLDNTYKGWDKGWVDHRVNDGKAIHILETKLAKSDEKLRSKYIWSQWDEAIKQLSRISGSTRVAKLGGENGTVFKTAILFIPIFVKSKEEKGVKQKYPSYVDDIIYKNLETMLSSWNLKRKPDWIASWLLPKSLQYPWNDDKGDYLWHSPAVLIIAKLCDKWEKNDSEKWTRVMN